MYCVKCGYKIEENMQFCPQCGIAVTTVTKRQRHGFTTFWLIFSIVSTLLFFPSFHSEWLFTDHTKGAILLLDIAFAIDIIAGILLLCWKRIGFIISIMTTLLVVIADIISGYSIGYILLNISMLAILYGILQIRKNGKSTWEQLK